MKHSCTLIKRDTQFTDHATSSKWECELDAVDNNGVSSKVVGLNIDFAEDYRDPDVGELESGVTILEATDVIVKDREVIVRGTPKLSRKNIDTHRRRRLAGEGNKTVLVIRVEAADKSTTSSAEILAREIFGITDSLENTDSFNLVSGYKQCSYNKLVFDPATGTGIVNGVYTAQISNIVTGTSDSVIREAASAKATEALGDLSALFDYVMFCLPPGEYCVELLFCHDGNEKLGLLDHTLH